LILVDFRGVDKRTSKKSFVDKLEVLWLACGALTSGFEFSNNRGLRRGFAIDFGYNPLAFHLFLIIFTDKASSLALE
jgi:hypothetical protein